MSARPTPVTEEHFRYLAARTRPEDGFLRELKHAPPLPEEMKGEPFIAVTSFTYTKKRDS